MFYNVEWRVTLTEVRYRSWPIWLAVVVIYETHCRLGKLFLQLQVTPAYLNHSNPNYLTVDEQNLVQSAVPFSWNWSRDVL